MFFFIIVLRIKNKKSYIDIYTYNKIKKNSQDGQKRCLLGLEKSLLKKKTKKITTALKTQKRPLKMV